MTEWWVFGSSLELTVFWHLSQTDRWVLVAARHLPSECLPSVHQLCDSPLLPLPREGWLEDMISGELEGPKE